MGWPQTGLIWWARSNGRGVYAVADGGRVVDCTPYAARWLAGRAVADLDRWDDGTVTCTATSAAPERVLLHLRTDVEPVRRWTHPGEGHLTSHGLTFGRVGDGWFVSSTQETHGWRFTLDQEAIAEAARRMAGDDRWQRVAARYDAAGRPVADVEHWSDAQFGQ